MLHALQSRRTQIRSHQSQNTHLDQQIRNDHTEAQQIPLMTVPRTQIEAMPPNRTPPILSAPVQAVYNPATTHPVFFMSSFRKPPFPLPLNAALNPVATGYVFAREGPVTGAKL